MLRVFFIERTSMGHNDHSFKVIAEDADEAILRCMMEHSLLSGDKFELAEDKLQGVPMDEKKMLSTADIGAKLNAGINDFTSQKQTAGKPRYYNRIDISCAIDGIAGVREYAINFIKKYPEAMSWKDIPASDFVDASQRHLNEINFHGIDAVDPEFPNQKHIHAIQWCMMVVEMKRRGRERELNITNFNELKEAGNHALIFPNPAPTVLYKNDITTKEGE